MSVINIKFTNEKGKDFYTNSIEHIVGKVIESPDWNPEPCAGGGLHFGEARVVICCLWEIYTQDRAFEVESIGKVVEITNGMKKARKLKIVKELNLPKLLSELAKDKDSNVREKAAAHPKTPISAILKLAKDKNYGVKVKVAAHPKTPIKILLKLFKDKGYGVKVRAAKQLAEKPNTPVKMLLEFSKIETWGVIYALLKNPNTPAEILLEYSGIMNDDVRARVASHPNTSAETLSFLAESEWVFVAYEMVKNVVAENPNTPIETVLRLSKHKTLRVREAALQSLKNRGISI